MDHEQMVETMIDACDGVRLDGSVTLMTGRNGSGKSLVRRQLRFRLPSGKHVVHTSMDLRTGLHSHMGALGGMVRDDEWLATSHNTFSSLRTALKSCEGHFLCIDEVEIGLGDELLLGIVAWLNNRLPEILPGTLGCLVITHSHLVVENLRFDHWLSLDGFASPEEWLARPVETLDPEEWMKSQKALFSLIRDRTKKD